jgi:hypothetical protein
VYNEVAYDIFNQLANPGTIHLEIIEVQSGSYFAGDDIVRLDDAYGRKSLWH